MTAITDFPVVWDDPADAEVNWNRDGVHGPEPVTPLGGSMADFVTHGFRVAFEEYSVPARLRMRVFNHWQYGAMTPLDLPPDELERVGGQTQEKLGGAMAQLGSLWNEKYLPEIKEILAALEVVDVAALSTAELTEHWDRTLAAIHRLWEIHFLVVVPSYTAMSEFDEMYRATVGATDPHESGRLLQGIGNMTVETGTSLFGLSRKAREAPAVRALIESTDGDVRDALATVEGGPAFLAELERYLEVYGHRGDKWDFAYPSWVDDATPVFTTLKEYVAQDADPADELRRQAAQREELVAEARAKITDEQQRGGFDFLLAAAESGVVISEDHGFWIDFRGMYELRRVCVEIGRRLADAGAIDDPDDIFFLYIDEIAGTLRALPDVDHRELVSDRKASLERAKATTPPPFIGAPPADEPPDNPIAIAFGKLFGGPPPADEGEVLRGHPGSGGTCRGTARILTSITDADRLQPGEVLVAPATAPPWTPFFAVAGAVVTDAGGILSHCAVVAREYQIPAVVGCGNATTTISDGQTVEVDGTKGTVRLIG